MEVEDIAKLQNENEILKAALRNLYYASEDMVSSDPDMPSHEGTEQTFEATMEATSKILQERCGGLGRS